MKECNDGWKIIPAQELSDDEWPLGEWSPRACGGWFIFNPDGIVVDRVWGAEPTCREALLY